MVKMTKLALACVDLSAHSATHPRLGSVDHVSVHPLKHASLHDAAACARDIGEAVSASETGQWHLSKELAQLKQIEQLESLDCLETLSSCFESTLSCHAWHWPQNLVYFAGI